MTMLNFTKQFEPLDLGIHGVRLPSFEVNEEDKRKLGVSEDISNEDFLKSLCEAGLQKYKIKEDDYRKRLNYEFTTVKDLGFVDYLLLVWEVINFCKKEKIPTGIGRGSAAGSLLLYLMGVTKIDPIKYDLYFERFISKIRAK